MGLADINRLTPYLFYKEILAAPKRSITFGLNLHKTFDCFVYLSHFPVKL